MAAVPSLVVCAWAVMKCAPIWFARGGMGAGALCAGVRTSAIEARGVPVWSAASACGDGVFQRLIADFGRFPRKAAEAFSPPDTASGSYASLDLRVAGRMAMAGVCAVASLAEGGGVAKLGFDTPDPEAVGFGSSGSPEAAMPAAVGADSERMNAPAACGAGL
ncbi:MAG: hypothetical protein R8K47_03830 [Mariprofundaceae bacterium]